MRRLAAGTLALTFAALPVAARADLFSAVSSGVHLSTTGIGLTFERPLLYDFSVRLTTNSLTVSQQLTYDATRYVSTNRYQNLGIIADYRPYAGRYRISGGLLFGNDRIDNFPAPNGSTIAVGSGSYPTGGVGDLTTQVRFDRPTIYLGVGTGTGLIRGFALEVDGGVEIRNGHAFAAATGPLATNAAFQADLERLRNELRTRIVTPVVSVGLVYRP